MIINLAALAAFLFLSLSKRCRHYSNVFVLCFGIMTITNYETFNLITPNVMLPVTLVQTLLVGYFAMSVICQHLIIILIRFRSLCGVIVSTLSIIALLNDILGLAAFMNWLSLDGYELRSRLIICLQFIAIWAFAGYDGRRALHVLYDRALRLVGRRGDG